MSARKATRWLALARLSDQWRDDPLDRQTADLLDVVERNGGDLIEPVLVERVSASQYRAKTAKRPGWDRIMAAASAGEIDGVAIYNIDRLTREPYAAELLLRAAEGGLKVADPATTVDLSTGDGRQFFRGKVAAAAAESDAISRRTRRANEQKRAEGRPFWSFRPFGFLLGDKATGVQTGDHHPDEAPVVREVYRRFVDGASLSAIAAWLNDAGWTQPERTERGSGEAIAKPWDGPAVKELLKADRNMGVHRSRKADGRERYETQRGTWAPIVDEDVFHAAKRLLATNAARYARNGNGRKHLLSGMLVCGVCGRPMSAWFATGVESYICRKDRGGCGLKASASGVESVVVDAVLGVLGDDAKREAMRAPSEQRGDRVALDAALQRLADRKATLLAQLDDPDLDVSDEDVRPLLVAIAKEAKALRAQRDEASRIESPALLLEADDPAALREGWDGFTLAQQQATVTDVLGPITVRPATKRGRTFDPRRVVCVPRY